MTDQSPYDAIAATYAEQFDDELNGKPFDTTLLDWLRRRVGSSGSICDLGCGPGHVAAHLHELGAETRGVDLSIGMIHQARRRHPAIRFDHGDMCDLVDVDDEAFGGIAAFYAIVNIHPDDHPSAFAEMFRVLQPRGWLLLSFHVGDGIVHVEEFLGGPNSLDFHFLDPPAVRKQLVNAGFTVTEAIERDSNDEAVEHPSRRAYLFARKH